MSKKEKQISIRLAEELLDQIKDAAEEMHVSVGTYIRIAAIEKMTNDKRQGR
jgi:predicted DNA binding CopG/RHH family protein